MKPIYRNIMAVLLGLLFGMLMNGGLVSIGTKIFPYPAGVDPNNMDQLKTLFNDAPLKYYIFPFLAHALGTLSGAWLASKIAISYQKYIGFGIGCCFLIGGLMVHYMIQGPPWFITIDLFMAYVPMGLLGWKFAKSKK